MKTKSGLIKAQKSTHQSLTKLFGKKFMSLVLCVCMLTTMLSAMPISVFAENDAVSANILENSSLFTEHSISLNIGEECPIRYNFDSSEYTVELDSANEEIVSVKDGKLIGLSGGTSKLYLTVLGSEGKYTDTCVVSVSENGKDNRDSDKVSLFGASVSGQNLYNEHISIVADSNNFSLGRTNGNAYSTADDDARLLFGWSEPGTSYATIVVDGNAEEYYASPTFDTSNQTIWGTMQKSGVTITRKLSIIKSPSTGKEDVAEITYTATNNDTSSHQVGGRIGLDTMLGDNDHSPFQIQGIGAVTTQTEFVGGQIPQYWQSFDSLTGSSISSYGTLFTGSTEKPDKVQFGNWGRLLSSSIWEASQDLGSANGDSAVAITWYQKALLPGQSRSFTTYYGLSAAETASQYTVKFDLRGGTGYCPSQTVLRNNFVIPPKSPTKPGYIFTGWYANKSCTGDPYISSTGTAKRKITVNITLYAGWQNADSIIWGKDTYKFINAGMFFGAKDYSISDEYYSMLIQNLNWYQKLMMKRHRNESWDGSCYGMSTVLSLAKMGYLSLGYFQSGAKNIYDLSYPKENHKIRSLINYYQLSQHLPGYEDKVFSDFNTTYLIKEIRKALLNDDRPTERPIIINYKFYGTNDKGKDCWMGHSVVGYRMTINDDDPVGLGYKIYIADPNNMLTNTNQIAPDGKGPLFTEGKPTFMYVSSNFDDISYGNYSRKDDTMKLVSVLTDLSMFDEISLQKSSSSASFKSARSVATMSMEENEKITLNTNYTDFDISSGDATAKVSESGIRGNFAIDEPYMSLDGNTRNYNIYEKGPYTISVTDTDTDTDTDKEEYKTDLTYDASPGCFAEATSAEKPDITIDVSGNISISTENAANKKIAVSAQSSELPWIGVSVEANTKDLTLLNNEDGTLSISSNQSLKGAVVTAINDNSDTKVVIEEDVTEFDITDYEGSIIISITELAKKVEQKIAFSVVYASNGGSQVDSCYDVSYGSTISEPKEPVYEGFIFDGWYIDEEFTKEWNFETDVVTDNLILYAKWDEDPAYYHLVTFYDGEETSQIVVRDGGSLTSADYPELTKKEGYYSEWQTINLTNITEDINVYSVNVPTDQTISASLNNFSYSDEKITGYIEYRSYIDGIAHISVSDSETDSVEKSVDVNISRGEDSRSIEIPFASDNKEHLLKICFWDNTEDRNVMGREILESFYAGRSEHGFYYCITEDGNAEIVGYEPSQIGWYPIVPSSFEGCDLTRIGDKAFSDAPISEIWLPDTLTEIGADAFENCAFLTINYAGSKQQWDNIKIAESNEALKAAKINYDRIEYVVDAYLENMSYTDPNLTVKINIIECNKDCCIVADIYDENRKLYITMEIGCINKGTTGEQSFEIPFKADDEDHRIEIKFTDTDTKTKEYGDGIYARFYAEKKKYTSADGLYEYALKGNDAEITYYLGSETDLVIPDNIDEHKVIGLCSYAIEGWNKNIKSITLPSALEYMEECAISYVDITEISLPASVKKIEPGVFEGCASLCDIKVDEQNENYCSIDGNLYTKDKKTLVQYAIGKTDEKFEIPSYVENIEDYALDSAGNIRDIKIPNSVKRIGVSALRTNAEYVYIPASVETIGAVAFCDCEYLKSITVDKDNPNYSDIDGVLFDKSGETFLQYPNGRSGTFYEVPDGTKKIESLAIFGADKLRTIILPASVTDIYEDSVWRSRALEMVLFRGGESEWEALTKKDAWNECALFNANRTVINYDLEYNEFASVAAKIESCEYDEDTQELGVGIKFLYSFEACAVMLAVYDSDNRLVAIDTKYAYENDGRCWFAIPSVQNLEGYTVKAFFRDAETGLKPLSGTVASTVK